MQMGDQEEQWLIVDDSATDRRRMMSALSTIYPGVRLVTASTVAEAQDILAQRPIHFCLLDFFLRGTTTERLIRSLRKQSPEIPILVVSGQAGSQQRIYNAGADAIIPKVVDQESFSLVIKSATLHAREIRRIRARRAQHNRIYLSEQLSAQLLTLVPQSQGHIWITSEAGMGRTGVARYLAERMQSKFENQELHDVLTINCSDVDVQPNIEAFLKSYAKPDSVSLSCSLQKVLILDDIDLLSENTLNRLKRILTIGMESKTSFPSNYSFNFRIIFTSKSEQRTKDIISQYFYDFCLNRIILPSSDFIISDFKKILNFAIRRESEQGRSKIKAERSFIRSLQDAVEKNVQKITLRSFMRTIEESVKTAMEDGRTLLIDSDLGNLEYLLDGSDKNLQSEGMNFNLPLNDAVGLKAWLQLYDASREKSFEDATAILRAIMLEYAMCKHRGNKTKVAAQLNVSRQHLYKPCMRKIMNSSV